MNDAREDLAALTDAQLATLGNVGLLKRARREVDAGRGPTLELEADGTLVGVSQDGATTRIGHDIRAALGHCTCGAARACRHRLAVVLEYQRQVGRKDQDAWNPGHFTDEQLLEVLGAACMKRAHELRNESVVVRVSFRGTPSAELLNATVTFWAKDALHLTRCDCGSPPCPQVALAVWAFREADEDGDVVLSAADDSPRTQATNVEPVVREILRTGFSALEGTDLFARARVAASDADHQWIADIFEDLERQKERYERRSTLFRPEFAAQCAAELLVRVRGANTLPATSVLGTGMKGSGGRTDRTRLIGLGAATDADGERRLAQGYFAEPISGTVLALHHEWSFEKDAPVGEGVGSLFASSRRSLKDLVSGYITVRGAKRRANGRLDLSRARAIQPSNAPGEFWGELEAPIRVRSLRAHEVERRNALPAMLGPRLLGFDVHVLELANLRDIGHSPGRQEMVAVVEDAEGTPCTLRVPHRTVSPGAIDATYRALEEGTRLVSGRLLRTMNGWELRVLGLVDRTQQLVIPDIAGERPLKKVRNPPLFQSQQNTSPFGDLKTLVERAIHRGFGSVQHELSPLAKRFEDAALLKTGRLVRQASQGVEPFLDLLVASALVGDAAGRVGQTD
ncbi:MAG: hypothetical protein AAF938_18495 [Myxococcota bacterium]